MTRCPETFFIQDFLDGERSEQEAVAFRVHLATCARCAADVALYRHAFDCLDRLPLARPAADLTERILDRVVPSRVRRRWVATAGWSYAGALAACLAAGLVWISQPGARGLLETLSGEASRRLVHSVIFALNALSIAVLSLADGWGVLAAAGERLAPLARALTALVSNPAILAALGAAGLSCAALLWWMRPRERHATREVRHVNVLGF